MESFQELDEAAAQLLNACEALVFERCPSHGELRPILSKTHEFLGELMNHFNQRRFSSTENQYTPTSFPFRMAEIYCVLSDGNNEMHGKVPRSFLWQELQEIWIGIEYCGSEHRWGGLTARLCENRLPTSSTGSLVHELEQISARAASLGHANENEIEMAHVKKWTAQVSDLLEYAVSASEARAILPYADIFHMHVAEAPDDASNPTVRSLLTRLLATRLPDSLREAIHLKLASVP